MLCGHLGGVGSGGRVTFFERGLGAWGLVFRL